MRRRITLLTTLVSVLAVVLFGVPLAVAVARNAVSDERGELQRSAATIAAAVSGDLSRNRPPSRPQTESGVQITVYDTHGTRISGDGPARAHALAVHAVTGSAGTGSDDGRLAAAVPVSDGDTITGAVLVTSTRHQVDGRIAVTWTAMLGLAVLAVALTTLIARVYSHRLAAPLEQLAQAADRIGAGDFTARAAPIGIAELDALGTTMNLSAERIADTVRRERAFSADASHQLRTPLTGLRLELETALSQTEHHRRQAILNALSTTDRLEHTITTLLALARDTPTPVTVPIDDLVNGIEAHWRGPLAARNRPLRIEVTSNPAPHALCSRAAVEQILDVLLDNALRHGRGAVTVTVRDADPAVAIDVRDEGPPLTTDPRAIFTRRTAGSPGHGHGIGLALARSLAEAEGGRLNLTNTHPPTFTLLLPAADARTPPAEHLDLPPR